MMLKTHHRGVASRPAGGLNRGFVLLAGVLCGLIAARTTADDALGVRVPDGFEVSLYADNELASDIFSMTIDSFGRVVVSGPGYVRILIDADGDGRAESFKQFAEGPASGAQGIHFYGRDLLCTGDAGLLRYRDADGDDVTDGVPDVFVKIKAGGEHDGHAIRRGPDGWWYLIAGNTAGVDEQYVALPSSPVRHPRHGTILRFKPDLTAGEVFAHGFRNAYDFDFNADGDLLTFDSDGEREISLPAYQPTRVFQATAGSHAGWMSDHWKRPAYFLDMPPVVAEFGRASPTGVVCYRHTQFPETYRGALFVLDWTFGRIFALPAARNGSVTGTKEPIPFLTAIGENGFAPTDAEVGPDGSLFVSVGGRGTRGGVYRIRAKATKAAAIPTDQLTACLDAPQPLSSWSRARWEPVADVLGADAFLRVATDERQTTRRRVRAIEILTERFKGIDATVANRLAASPSREVRARLAWSLGRSRPQDPAVPPMQTLLKDNDPAVLLAALETAVSSDWATLDELAIPIGNALGCPDRFVRMAAVRAMARMSRSSYAKAAAAGLTRGAAAGIGLAVAYSHRHPGYEAYSVDIARRILESSAPSDLKLDAARLMQIGLGDVGAIGEGRPEAFEGYTSRVDLSKHAAEFESAYKSIDAIFPTADAKLDAELGRLIAMLQPGSSDLLMKVVARISPESNPVDDMHWLLVAGRVNAPRTPEITAAIARALVAIEAKIKERSLLIDAHWDEQLAEITTALVERDGALPLAILNDPEFGRPSHIQYVAAMPIEKLQEVIAAFVRRIDADPEFAWNGDVLFLLSRSEEPRVQAMVRSKFDDQTLRGAVILSISDATKEEDRQLFVAGLSNGADEIVSTSLDCLSQLTPSADATEQVALTKLLRRLGDTRRERKLRNRITERLTANLGVSFQDDDGDGPSAVQKWISHVEQKFPASVANENGSAVDVAHFSLLLARAEWETGDFGRGRKLFETRQCIQCHSGRGAVGPDLNGVARRFSRDDLFTAIVNPSRDVSPRYETTVVSTADGRSLTGLVIYESVDYVVIRNASGQTSRIEKKNIEERRTQAKSLMPEGLLKDTTPGDLADLYAYLRELGAPQMADAESAASK